MAINGNLQLIPGLVAGADQTNNQFCFMKMGSADFTVVITAAATDAPIGVLQDTPLSGDSAGVAFSGITKIVLGGTVTRGDRVGTDANGHAVKYTEGTDTTSYISGIMLESGSSGDIRSMVLLPVPHRAA